jgi:hypothetical protein
MQRIPVIVLSINKISYHLIWIFGLLEMITVPMVAWLPQITSLQTKSPWQGAVVGFFGVVVLFLILNSMIFRLKIRVDGEVVKKISVLPAALWNTLFLALIFGIQKIAGMTGIESWVPRYMFAGFVSVSGAVLITLLVYGRIGHIIPCLRLYVRTTRYMYPVRKFPVMMVALLAGAYEATALPLIMLWQKAESEVPLVAAVTGLAGGVVGCSAIVILFNRLKFLHLNLTLEKKTVEEG